MSIKKRGLNKRLTILEISILIVSIFSFSFLLSQEIRIVNAIVSWKKVPDERSIGDISLQEWTGGNYRYYYSDEAGENLIGRYNIKTKEYEKLISEGSTTPQPTSWSKVFGLEPIGLEGKESIGAIAQPYVQAFIWAGYVYGAAQMIGSLFGMEKEQVNAFSQAAALGTLAGRGSFLLFGKEGFFAQKGWLGKFAGITGPQAFAIGVGVAAIVFLTTYKEESYKVVEFNCLPWEAPVGGEYCEKCNVGDKECSEYRCKSLGQACELLNPGTGEEKCVWVNPKDVESPIIQPLNGVLSAGYEYADVKVRPPGTGMKIIKKGGECIQAFTPIEFGINTNEPTQCKIDYNHTRTYEEMQYYFGESNLYDYNHTQKLNLPGPDAVSEQLEIENDGIYTLYVRCRDANGNYNEDEYAIRFCVEPGPDTTPPVIEETSILDRMPVAFGVDEVNITIYLNEPAECRWSRIDQVYDNMENQMECSTNFWEIEANLLYACSGTLTGIKDREENVYYFRCKDQPWLEGTEEEVYRNVMVQSKELTLIGTQPLNIKSIAPNGTITGATSIVSIELELETAYGYKDGEANCYYNPTGNEEDYVLFYETNSYRHIQRQDLPAGEYTYYFKCVDLGGNTAYNQTRFTIYIDTEPPKIIRAYNDRNNLKIITNEDATCVYSTINCDYKFGDEGLMPMPHASASRPREHFADWDPTKTYYIKCKDINNIEPNPTECSIVVRANEMI